MVSLAANNYALLFIALGLCGIGAYVLHKDPARLVNRSFFIFTGGGALWIFGLALLSLTENFSFDLIISYGGLLFVLGFFLLAQAFPPLSPVRLNPYALYAPFLIVAVCVIPWRLINTGMRVGENGALQPIPGPLLLPFGLVLLCYIAASLWILWRKFRSARGWERSQLRYLLLGAGAFVLSALVFDALLPAVGVTSLNLMGPLSAFIFMALIAHFILRQELEDKVEERTGELRAVQENRQQMMLDISHGLQTPLAIFQSKLEQLKLTVPDDVAIVHLETSLADLSNFIHKLLKLARLENNQEDIAMAPVCLTDLLAEVVEEVETIAAAHDISIRHRIAADIYVRGDAEKIKEVVMNLASNSIKYMRPRGKKEIVFSLTTEGADAVLLVSDSGVGITKEDMAHIFERFYRVPHSPGRISGSGLGLAISKRIVGQHGGTLVAESEFGKGTTIQIRLPLVSKPEVSF